VRVHIGASLQQQAHGVAQPSDASA
jgi:hypothetical protein